LEEIDAKSLTPIPMLEGGSFENEGIDIVTAYSDAPKDKTESVKFTLFYIDVAQVGVVQLKSKGGMPILRVKDNVDTSVRFVMNAISGESMQIPVCSIGEFTMVVKVFGEYCSVMLNVPGEPLEIMMQPGISYEITGTIKEDEAKLNVERLDKSSIAIVRRRMENGWLVKLQKDKTKRVMYNAPTIVREGLLVSKGWMRGDIGPEKRRTIDIGRYSESIQMQHVPATTLYTINNETHEGCKMTCSVDTDCKGYVYKSTGECILKTSFEDSYGDGEWTQGIKMYKNKGNNIQAVSIKLQQTSEEAKSLCIVNIGVFDTNGVDITKAAYGTKSVSIDTTASKVLDGRFDTKYYSKETANPYLRVELTKETDIGYIAIYVPDVKEHKERMNNVRVSMYNNKGKEVWSKMLNGGSRSYVLFPKTMDKWEKWREPQKDSISGNYCIGKQTCVTPVRVTYNPKENTGEIKLYPIGLSTLKRIEADEGRDKFAIMRNGRLEDAYMVDGDYHIGAYPAPSSKDIWYRYDGRVFKNIEGKKPTGKSKQVGYENAENECIVTNCAAYDSQGNVYSEVGPYDGWESTRDVSTYYDSSMIPPKKETPTKQPMQVPSSQTLAPAPTQTPAPIKKKIQQVVPIITVYEHEMYKGKSQDYPFSKMTKGIYTSTLGNMKISSIKVPYGMKVTVYRQKSLKGESISFTHDVPTLRFYQWAKGKDWNDEIKSLRVEIV
jgi:hypothetical protein